MSEYLAVLAIVPALRHTKQIFWPIKTGQILRLLIISFFIGAWITSPIPQDYSYADIPYLSALNGTDVITEETGRISMVMTGILFILLVYALLSSIFQFIFVDYLSAETLRILPSLKMRIGMGLRLMSFYLSIILIIGLCAVGAIIGIAMPVLIENPDNQTMFFVALIYTLTGLLILILPVWVLTIITTDFVVPVMMVHLCGIIQGWTILLREFSGRWDEVGIYLLIKISIDLVVGIILGVMLVLVMHLLGFPVMLIIPGLSTSTGYSLFEAIIPFLIMAVITLFVMTPVVTFLRYYALVFLELLSETYTLLPEVYQCRR